VSDGRVLSLSFRPRRFSELVGQKKIAERIVHHLSSGRMPAAWMFVGDSGSGKTTIARILAHTLQCKHGQLGEPCDKCLRKTSSFNIIEINASEVTGKEDIGEVVSSANFMPQLPSRYRVFILDEAQQLSMNSQNLLLKYFEDSPPSTVWIICTTHPEKILRTLRRRCVTYTIPPLSLKAVGALVTAAFAKCGVKSAQKVESLSDALNQRGVASPGFIVMAVEKFLAGSTAEQAAAVGFDATVDTLQLCRFVVRGDWERVRSGVFSATPDDARAIRASLAGYLKSILLDCAVGEKKAAKMVRAIERLGGPSYNETEPAGTIACLYDLCKIFGAGG
jgi:hypothetical protein